MKQTVSKQLTTKEEQQKKKDRREGRGVVLALSRHVYNLQNKNSTFYVESESCDSRYYFVRYNPSVFEWCSCKDFESNRTERCKHLYGVEYGIRFNTILEVDKLPEEVHSGISRNSTSKTTLNKSWKDDDYSF